MVTVQVKKVVAVCFLEATKQAMDQLGEHRLQLSQQGVAGPPDLPRLYGDARRLRDYLQRCTSAHQDLVELDLADADVALLVACCRRAVEGIDLRIDGAQAVPAEERQWLQRKRTVLADWAVALVARPPLLELPLPRLSPVPTHGYKALQARLHQKLFEGGHQHRIQPSAAQGPGASAGVAAPTAGWNAASPLADLWQDQEPPLKVAGEAGEPLLDPRLLRDGRLRGLVPLDLRSYERAVQAQDHRLAMVLLGSLLEAALVDHLLAHKAEFGLQSTPDHWPLPELLAKVLGERLEPPDRMLVFHAFTARNLLRPALQLVTPTVVTAATVQRLEAFVRRALHGLGCGTGMPPAATGQPQPPGEPRPR
ncbi:MAG: hypothetical protein JNK49_20495 [Planctomycetes bacterium]|nr:hypothetical protein [Planctomycetota bacterium]